MNKVTEKHRKALRLGGIFLLAFLFLLSGEGLAAPERKAILSKVQGSVEVRVKNEEWKPARMGMILHEPDELRTGKNGHAETLLDDGGSTGKIRINENSYIRFHTMVWEKNSGDKKTQVDVAWGKIKVYAEKLRGKSKFEVNTPTAVLSIRGTVFEVKVSKEKSEGKSSL